MTHPHPTDDLPAALRMQLRGLRCGVERGPVVQQPAVGERAEAGVEVVEARIDQVQRNGLDPEQAR